MDKVEILDKIKDIYENNGNIIKYLKKFGMNKNNSIEDILISYDFQAGSYIRKYNEDSKLANEYCKCLSKVLNDFGKFNSLLEVGVGEATTLGNLINLLNNKPEKIYGFDLSWSRIKYANSFLDKLKIYDIELFVGDLFCIPLKENSIDVVYTSHSIEPNGEREEEALRELYRITNKYLVLLEPSYELASAEAKNRMMEHGYITKLYSTAVKLGYKIIEHRLFDISANTLNPTGLLIISKEKDEKIEKPLCCPITKSDIMKVKNVYFSEQSLLAYPVIDDIPCLLKQNAIVATKLLDEL